jgi:hypothetical protein
MDMAEYLDEEEEEVPKAELTDNKKQRSSIVT